MSHAIEKDVVCPFFREQPSNGLAVKSKAQEQQRRNWERKRIRCEGVTDGSYLVIQFEHKEARKAYKKKYCTKFNYKECPIAKMLEEKYKEGEKND